MENKPAKNFFASLSWIKLLGLGIGLFAVGVVIYNTYSRSHEDLKEEEISYMEGPVTNLKFMRRRDVAEHPEIAKYIIFTIGNDHFKVSPDFRPCINDSLLQKYASEKVPLRIGFNNDLKHSDHLMEEHFVVSIIKDNEEILSTSCIHKTIEGHKVFLPFLLLTFIALIWGTNKALSYWKKTQSN